MNQINFYGTIHKIDMPQDRIRARENRNDKETVGGKAKSMDIVPVFPIEKYRVKTAEYEY